MGVVRIHPEKREEEFTATATKFTKRSSGGKSDFPKSTWTMPVLSARYSRQIVRGRLATGIVKNSHQIQPPSTSLDCNLTQSPSVIY
jgi:hypothetical protein